MNLVNGSKLKLAARAEALARFIYRLTTENGYPQRNPCGARVPAISDEEWLANHDFYVTNSGKLLNRHGHCEPAGVFTAEVTRDMTPDYEVVQ
jgi:hypothetical protein